MRIDITFSEPRNEMLINLLKQAHGDRVIIDELCDTYGEIQVLNALYHASKDADWPEEHSRFRWEDRIQEWLYQYFYEDCMVYVLDEVVGDY